MEDICADSTSVGPSGLLKMVVMLMVRTRKLTCQPIPMLSGCSLVPDYGQKAIGKSITPVVHVLL